MGEESDTKTIVVESAKTRPSRGKNPKILPPFNVILLDDDDHTYEYVIRMLMQLFGHPVEAAYEMACKVDADGRVVVDTTSKERAELKRDQIHAFGRDALLKRCKGSMSATIEPCPGG